MLTRPIFVPEPCRLGCIHQQYCYTSNVNSNTNVHRPFACEGMHALAPIAIGEAPRSQSVSVLRHV
jgi:hypothetical protein